MTKKELLKQFSNIKPSSVIWARNEKDFLDNNFNVSDTLEDAKNSYIHYILEIDNDYYNRLKNYFQLGDNKERNIKRLKNRSRVIDAFEIDEVSYFNLAEHKDDAILWNENSSVVLTPFRYSSFWNIRDKSYEEAFKNWYKKDNK